MEKLLKGRHRIKEKKKILNKNKDTGLLKMKKGPKKNKKNGRASFRLNCQNKQRRNIKDIK